MIEVNVALIGWQEIIELIVKPNVNLMAHKVMIADMSFDLHHVLFIFLSELFLLDSAYFLSN